MVTADRPDEGDAGVVVDTQRFSPGDRVVLEAPDGAWPKTRLRIVDYLGGAGQASAYRVRCVGPQWSRRREALPAHGLVLRVEFHEPPNQDLQKLQRRNRQLVELGDLRHDAAQGLVRVRRAGVVKVGRRIQEHRFAQLLDDAGTPLSDLLPAPDEPPGGDRHSRYTPDQWGAIFAPAARGVAYLHQSALLHRDIKPHNFLVVQRPRRTTLHGLVGEPAEGLLARGLPFVRLSDFGTLVDGAVEEGRPQWATTQMFYSGPYVPPEVLLSHGRARPQAASDTWMFACSMFQAMTGRLPFAGFDDDRAAYYSRVQKEEFDEPVWATLPPGWAQLLRRALAAASERRAAMADIERACSRVDLGPAPARPQRIRPLPLIHFINIPSAVVALVIAAVAVFAFVPSVTKAPHADYVAFLQALPVGDCYSVDRAATADADRWPTSWERAACGRDPSFYKRVADRASGTARCPEGGGVGDSRVCIVFDLSKGACLSAGASGRPTLERVSCSDRARSRFVTSSVQTSTRGCAESDGWWWSDRLTGAVYCIRRT